MEDLEEIQDDEQDEQIFITCAELEKMQRMAEKRAESINLLAARFLGLLDQCINLNNFLPGKHDGVAKFVLDHVQNSTDSVVEFSPAFLNAGRSVDELAAIIVFVSLVIAGVDVNASIRSIQQKNFGEFGDLRAFSNYVDIVEVFKSASWKEFCSLNPLHHAGICPLCVTDTTRFLNLCEELTRIILRSEMLGRNEASRACLERIIRIERSYSEACTQVTKMTILQEVDIWGRSWGLELQKEDDIGKGTKKRRMDNEEDNVEDEKAQSSSIEQQQKMDSGKKAQDNQNQNQRKTVREDIKRLVCDQLDLLDNVQFLDATVIPINVSQAILHSEQNLQNINELNKIENSELDQKCSVSNESGELKPNNIGLYHSIPPIISILNAQQGISPFAQRFMQINMHLPFYIVAREEELWNAAEWTILQPYAGQQKEHSPKGVQSSSGSDTWIRGKQKINESLFIFVYSLIFGKKSQSNIREIRTRSRDIGIWEENDILQYCFTVTGRIELETQLLEQEQRRAGYERWMMPDMRSPEFISIQQSIIQKLEQVSPDSSLIAKKNFSQIQKNPREEGIGPLPLRFSRDLLAIYHGVSSQHINDTLKKIQKKRSQIFEKVRPFWCEVFTQGQDDNNSNSSQIEDESFDQDEQDDEQMRKIKRKRGD